MSSRANLLAGRVLLALFGVFLLAMIVLQQQGLLDSPRTDEPEVERPVQVDADSLPEADSVIPAAQRPDPFERARFVELVQQLTAERGTSQVYGLSFTYQTNGWEVFATVADTAAPPAPGAEAATTSWTWPARSTPPVTASVRGLAPLDLASFDPATLAKAMRLAENLIDAPEQVDQRTAWFTAPTPADPSCLELRMQAVDESYSFIRLRCDGRVVSTYGSERD